MSSFQLATENRLDIHFIFGKRLSFVNSPFDHDHCATEKKPMKYLTRQHPCKTLDSFIFGRSLYSPSGRCQCNFCWCVSDHLGKQPWTYNFRGSKVSDSIDVVEHLVGKHRKQAQITAYNFIPFDIVNWVCTINISSSDITFHTAAVEHSEHELWERSQISRDILSTYVDRYWFYPTIMTIATGLRIRCHSWWLGCIMLYSDYVEDMTVPVWLRYCSLQDMGGYI